MAQVADRFQVREQLFQPNVIPLSEGSGERTVECGRFEPSRRRRDGKHNQSRLPGRQPSKSQRPFFADVGVRGESLVGADVVSRNQDRGRLPEPARPGVHGVQGLLGLSVRPRHQEQGLPKRPS